MLSLLKLARRSAAAVRSLECRTFMSDEFRCEKVWAQRLESPILQKVKVGDMFLELDSRLSHFDRRVAAVDIDVFANSVTNVDNMEELDDVLHRFRLRTETCKTLPSTHHAVVRAFLNYGDPLDLLRVLNDRLNYGIFTDDYLNVFLMDYFVKKEDYTSASKIATMRMLQEDFSHELSNYMSLYVCHKYLSNPTEWEPPPEPEPNEEDEEVIKVRVKYLRNPFFDDHFDLKDPNSLVGKTFHAICRHLDNPLATNYRAMGLCLHKKWEEAEQFISNSLNEKTQFYSSAIDIIDKFIGSLSEEEQKPLDSLKSVVTTARNSSVNNDLLSETLDKVKALVSAEERKMIDNQNQVYSDWEDMRESVLKNELEELKRIQRLKEVQRKKDELQKEEEEIFFFENQDKLDMIIEAKRRRPKKEKKSAANADDYVPPEIETQKPWVN